MSEHDPRNRHGQNRPAYDEDYAAWIGVQLDLLRTHRFSELDIDNLAEEVSDLGASSFKAFVSAIRIVLLHMIKWDIQEDYRSRSWSNSIDEHRRRLSDELEASPSYQARIDSAVMLAYRQARTEAAAETRLPLRSFAEICPYGWDEIQHRTHDLAGDTPTLTGQI